MAFLELQHICIPNFRAVTELRNTIFLIIKGIKLIIVTKICKWNSIEYLFRT
jgi:hypothetical protein